MRILALDTSTRATTVALCGCDPDSALEARDDPAPGERPGHARRVLGLARELLAQAGCAWSDLDRIVVGRGPGSFTGLRIGIATARALAASLQRPLVGVSTLQSLALGYQAQASEGWLADIVLAVLDARRGEVFVAAWRTPTVGDPKSSGGLGPQLLAPCALSPEGLTEVVASFGAAPLALGDGAVGFRATLERAGAVIPSDGSDLHRVTAINHCRLACGMAATAPDQVQPDYLRLPDAEIARQAAASDAP
jgi:tRNA threonylcarbamoyladenosine biosynthesis protein TsaB